MSDHPVQIAIIGCGWAGSRHADVLAAAGASLRWAVDTNLDRAERIAARHPGARAATDYREALRDQRVTAVDICLPHNLHSSPGVEAAEYGKHVLVEKPLAHSLPEADRMIEAAERAGVILMVAENVRFEPALLKAQALIESGVIGEPALAQVVREAYLAESFLAERRWFLDAEKAAGGIMMSGGVHDFEKLRMVMAQSAGEVTEVNALRARQRFQEMGGDDTSVATVRFQNGAVGTLVESFVMKSAATASGREVHTMRVDGDLGSLAIPDSDTVRVYSERHGWQASGGGPVEHTFRLPPSNSFELTVAHFIECVQAGREPLTSGVSQRRPLSLVFAAYASMAVGQPVKV